MMGIRHLRQMALGPTGKLLCWDLEAGKPGQTDGPTDGPFLGGSSRGETLKLRYPNPSVY